MKEGENNLKLDTKAGVVPERIYIKSKHDTLGDNVRLPTADITTNPFTIDDDSQTGTKQGEQQQDQPQVETVDEHEDDEDYSPMDDPPLQEQPEVKTVDADDDEDVAEHLKLQRQPGDPNPKKEPLSFEKCNLHTLNPVDKGIPPEQMIDRTFLMPPQDDGTRVRAKIIKMVNDYKQNLADHPELVKFKMSG